MLGGLLRGLVGFFTLVFGPVGVIDAGRLAVQKLQHAQEIIRVERGAQALYYINDYNDATAWWDSIRVDWLSRFTMELEKSPAFAIIYPDEQRQVFEHELEAQHSPLLDRLTGQAYWHREDADPTPETLAAGLAREMHVQQSAMVLLHNQRQAFEHDAEEFARLRARTRSLRRENQTRDEKAYTLLETIKQLQLARYQLLVETARDASSLGLRLHHQAVGREAFGAFLGQSVQEGKKLGVQLPYSHD